MNEPVQSFVLAEAGLLDDRRFPEWLALFADDGVYWVPTSAEDERPEEALALIYEPKPLLALRVERLQRPDLHAASPPPRTVHHVSAIAVRATNEHIEARSSLILAQWRAGEARWFAARVLHRLRPAGDSFRIVLKRVDLVDAEAPHRALTVPF